MKVLKYYLSLALFVLVMAPPRKHWTLESDCDLTVEAELWNYDG